MSIPYKPHAGQRLAIRWLLEHSAAGLFADPGTGKTSSVLASFKILKKEGVANKMLVIAPLRPCSLVWGPDAEPKKWKDFNHFRVEVLHGPNKDEALHRDADIYVMNPNGLDWLAGAEAFKNPKTGKTGVIVDVETFKTFEFDTLVLDELTLWKGNNTARVQTMKALLDTFSRRWGLTGTPAPNGLGDLFSQIHMLDQGAAFGPYITHFRNSYFLPSYDRSTYILKADGAERIYERIRPLVLRLEARDFIEMPVVVENIIPVELPAAAKTIYKTLESEMMVQLDKATTLTAPTAAAISMKLRQIASGAVYVSDAMGLPTLEKRVKAKKEWVDIHDAKIDALLDLVVELQGQPVLIAYEFRHDLEKLRAALSKHLGCKPDEVPYIGAGVAEKKTKELETAWNKGELPVLLGHCASLAHGLNLQQSSNHVCWFTITWNREHYDQFIARVARQGSKFSRVFVHLLLATGTLDRRIYAALKNKSSVQSALLDALKDLKAERRRTRT